VGHFERKVLWHLFSQMVLPKCPVFWHYHKIINFTALQFLCNHKVVCKYLVPQITLYRMRYSVTTADCWDADLDSSDETFDEI